jgi:hypothetical protein
MPDQCSRHETGQAGTIGGTASAGVLIVALTAAPAARIR